MILWLFDNAMTCTPNKNGTEPHFTWDVCPPPTADTSEAVIPFGKQPTTQLSLDYLMQENYAGALASHAGSGIWAGGVRQDGWFRQSLPFEPLCNCPESGHDGVQGLRVNGFSQIWESAVMADMWDQLIFIGGDYEWTSVASSAATRMHELRPAFRRKFGSAPRPSISVAVVEQGRSCLNQHDATSEKLAGGPLRAQVWTEATPGNATTVCAHIVVINTALTATYAFTANISCVPALAKNPASAFPMVANRLFEFGAAMNLSQTGQLSADYIGPGTTHVYAVGCSSPWIPGGPTDTELATPLVRVADVLTPGWSTIPVVSERSDETEDYAHSTYDPQFAVYTDTAVAVPPARHSLRFNIPTGGKPTLIGFPGKQLVPAGPYGKQVHWDPVPKDRTKPGDKVTGSCLNIPGGASYKVSLLLQATPCGTSVTLMGGAWQVTGVVDREGAEDVTGIYSGKPLAPAVNPCGSRWTALEAIIKAPAATAAVNGTALQLQFLVPKNALGLGGSVWLGAASVAPM